MPAFLSACRPAHPPPKTTAGREDMELLGVKLNGCELSAEQYERRPRSLTIPATVLPEGGFELEVRRQCS